MKRMITGIAVLAIVSGALAFKSSHLTNPKLYCADKNTDVVPLTQCVLEQFKEGGFQADPCPGLIPGTKAHILNTDPSHPNTCTYSLSSVFTPEI